MSEAHAHLLTQVFSHLASPARRLPEDWVAAQVAAVDRPEGDVDALLTVPDRSLFLAGTYAWLGFRQEPRRVEKGLRAGKSTYSPRRLVTLLLDAITSFSSYPLRLIFGVGVLIAAVAIGWWRYARPVTASVRTVVVVERASAGPGGAGGAVLNASGYVTARRRATVSSCILFSDCLAVL